MGRRGVPSPHVACTCPLCPRCLGRWTMAHVDGQTPALGALGSTPSPRTRGNCGVRVLPSRIIVSVLAARQFSQASTSKCRPQCPLDTEPPVLASAFCPQGQSLQGHGLWPCQRSSSFPPVHMVALASGHSDCEQGASRHAGPVLPHKLLNSGGSRLLWVGHHACLGPAYLTRSIGWYL